MGQYEDDGDALMAKVRQRDGAALESLYHRWKQPLMNYFHRMTGSLDDSEELVLKVFEQLWKTAVRYQPCGRFPAWIFTLARRQLQHHWRALNKNLPAERAPESHPEQLDNATPSETIEGEEALRIALQSLPEDQREALLLHVHSNLSGSEMANVMNIPLSRFHVLVHRAKLNFKQQMETYFHA